ncbi:MAG: hypothetical protein JWM39_597 [Parcubacteria group bacterium]|nr:hypothetical protein [Parcubacteria group bacterium]
MAEQNHLEWCKVRALDVLKSGDIPGAYASMVTDLRSDSSTENHPAIMLGMQLMMGGHLSKPEEMEKFINDFN